MVKATVARLNIKLTAHDQAFFAGRLQAFQNDFGQPADMHLHTTAWDEIGQPAGRVLEQVKDATVLRTGEDRVCNYIRSSQTGRIVMATYANVDYSEVEIQLLKNNGHPQLSTTDLEYMYTGFAFADRLTALGGIILHGSAIAYHNQGIIFSANIGKGKSTHAGLWRECFGDAVVMVNDDKPAIRFYAGAPWMFGTPWSGKTDLNTNVQVPLKAIVFIDQAAANRIAKLPVRESIFNLTAQIPRPYYDARLGLKALDIVEQLVSTVPIYKLHCNISREAVDTVYHQLTKEGAINV